MERAMKEAIATGNKVPDADANDQSDEILWASRKQVSHYLQALGLIDHYLIQQLAEECLSHAKRRAADDTSEEFLRRALEEAQRRVDHALARALGLPPSRDPKPIAAARAAMLLARGAISVDALFLSPEASDEAASRIREALPRAMPPEEPLEMQPTPLRFWLFKST
jgi:hypothetical protein